MTKHLIVLTAIALAVFSCKKDDTEPTNPSAASYTVPSSAGSYWVYHWSRIDSLGNETPMSAIDTIRITGDSVVNGNTYTVYTGSYLGGPDETWLERDSGGYIVKSNGYILYSYNHANTTLRTLTDVFYNQEDRMGGTVPITGVGGGLVDGLDLQKVLTRATASTLPNPTGVNACGDETYTFHTYYVSGIGKIREETAYYSQFANECKTMYRSLVDYYIAP